ncbi:MAG: hypothetical protein AAFX56_11280 [Pseudomonadota bacterium]
MTLLAAAVSACAKAIVAAPALRYIFLAALFAESGLTEAGST